MPRIHVLDKAVAELIAAGEVVERPSSIVKELVENSVDSGATAVTVEIRGGGVSYIRVTDNGCGIEREDIPRAFVRHATSKVRTADDLSGILTFGFRGEALASIAAMCRVELTTRTEGAAEGTTCRVEGGEPLDSFPAGCPVGTTIIVRDVFFNTPARMKFLKKDSSEGNSVAQVMDKCAMSHPEVAFRFIRDNQTKLRTTGSGDLLAVIRAVCGKELADTMLPVDYTYENRIHVRGYVSSPAGSKASRTGQNFFINGRYVRTRTASAALEEAFKGKLMSGKFPACVLDIGIDAETVDVNVHPAKIEVRFTDERPVFQSVYFAVKTALSAVPPPLEPAAVTGRASGINALTMHEPRREYTQQRLASKPVAQPSGRMSAEEFRNLFGGEREEKPDFKRPVGLRSRDIDISVDDAPAVFSVTSEYSEPPENDVAETFSRDGTNFAKNATIIEEESESPPTQAEEQPEIRLLSEAFATYILLERGDDLLLVDKHAAHERIIYERLRENIAYGNRQLLLAPVTITLPGEDYGALLEGLDRVEAMGFGLEDFGDGAVILRETPVELGPEDAVHIIGEIAAKLRRGSRDLTPEALDRLYYSIACRAAVKAGDRNNERELGELVERLRQNPDITHCPHGRPVAVRLTRREIEKLFGRIQ